jgi:hypothetical protein
MTRKVNNQNNHNKSLINYVPGPIRPVFVILYILFCYAIAMKIFITFLKYMGYNFNNSFRPNKRSNDNNDNNNDDDFQNTESKKSKYLTKPEYDELMKNDIQKSKHFTKPEFDNDNDNSFGFQITEPKKSKYFTKPEYYGVMKNDIQKYNKNLIFNGPPGTGKTMTVNELASDLNYKFISVDSSSIKDHYYGQTDKKLKNLFLFAAKNVPCIVFLDEADGLIGNRSDTSKSGTDWTNQTVVTNLNKLIQEAPKDIHIILATNFKDKMDAAIVDRFKVYEFNEFTNEQKMDFIEGMIDDELDSENFNTLPNGTKDFVKKQVISILKKHIEAKSANKSARFFKTKINDLVRKLTDEKGFKNITIDKILSSFGRSKKRSKRTSRKRSKRTSRKRSKRTSKRRSKMG